MERAEERLARVPLNGLNLKGAAHRKRRNEAKSIHETQAVA
jgi:hypothetical protein